MAEYRLEFEADSGAAERSIFNLRKSIKEVTKEFEKSEIGAEDFVAAASEISKLKKEYNDARNAVANIDKAYRDLNKAIEANFAVQTKALGAATKYHKDVLQLAQESVKEEDRLRNKNFQAEQNDWDRRLKIAVAAKNKIAAQEKAIMDFRAGMGARGAIPSVASPVRGGINFPDSPDYKKAMADAAAKAAGQAKSGGGVAIPAELKFQPYSLAYYESKLKALSAQARLISPESKKWKELNTDILKAERGIKRIQKRQKLGPTAGQRAGAAGGAFLYGGGMGGGLASAFGGIAGGLAGGVPGAFAGAAIGQVVDNLSTALAGITSQASKVQQLQRGLALASIDAKDFAQAQAAVADVSARLFIPLEQVTKSFSQLRVNTKQYGLSVEETKQILEGTILAVSAFGGSADDVDGAMRAVVQILSKGSVQAEELRGQLGERFPGAVIKFAQTNKLSFDELQSRLKEGTIGIKEFVTFAKENYEDYAAFSEKLATAPEFAGRRLQIALEQISLEVGGLFGPMGADIQDGFTQALKGVGDFVKENKTVLKQMIQDFNSIIVPIAKVFGELLKILGVFAFEIAKVFTSLFQTIKNAIGMASIGSAKARLDKAKAATAGKTRPTPARGDSVVDVLTGKTVLRDVKDLLGVQNEFEELDAAQKQFNNLGGMAAYSQASQQAGPSDLVFGGPGAGVDITAGAADQDKAAKKKQESLESYDSLQDQLAKNFTQDQLDRMEQEYQARVNRINSEFDLREARANSFQKEAINFERQMSDIELKRQKALLDASAEVIKAQGSVAGGAGGGKGLGAGIAQYITGDPASPFYKADHGGGNYHEHLAFVSREAAEEAYRKLTSAGIQVTEFKGKSRVGRHTPGSAHYEGLAFDVPGAQVPVGQEPQLTARVQSILGIGGAGAPRKVTGDEKRDVIADQKAQLAVAQQSLTVRLADAQAIRDAAVAWAQYTAAIVPVEEQALQNDILAKKNELVKASLPEDIIEKEMKYFEAQQKTTLAMENNDKLLAKGTIDQKEHANRLLELKTRLAGYNTELDKNIQLQRQQSFDASMTALNKQMELAGIIDPRAELRARISQEKPGYTPGQVEEEAAAQERIAQLEASRDRIRGIASSIGDAFGTAFKGIITGSMTAQEALAGMFQSIADSFADMVAKMIAEWLKAQLIKGFANLVGSIFGGGGGGGLGSMDANIAQYAPLPTGYANGGIASGGFTAFANGGMVTGPTMGLVGEGRYNEAIVPLPDGKSIPVQLAGGDGGNQIISNITVNVNNGQAQSDATGANSSEMGRKIEGAVKQVIVGELRPGGLLASKK